jgi:transposase
MIIASGAVRVLVSTQPVDFRKGMDGLAAVVRESLGFSLLLRSTFVIS